MSTQLLRIDRAASAVDRLRSAGQVRRLAEAEELRAISDLAHEHDWTTTDELDVVGERAVRVGSDGTPRVGEFLPLEVAAATGVSVEAATWLIRDVLNLQCRLPKLWNSVLAGAVSRHHAIRLVQVTARYDLTLAQVTAIDDRLASRYGRVGWPRVMRHARGLIAQLATEQVEAAAKRAREARFVKTASTDEPLVTELWARLDTADAQQLEASVQAIAKALKALGDDAELDVRRSRALGILATPGRAAALLEGRDDERYVPRTKVYVHMSADLLDTARCVARSETLGPLTRTQLAELFGTTRITVTPVLHAGDDPAVDNYEVPARMRERIVLRDGVEPFPYSSRSARNLDADHTTPYRPGVKGQTRASTWRRCAAESIEPRPPGGGGFANPDRARSGGSRPLAANTG